jgi:hypothetical protein
VPVSRLPGVRVPEFSKRPSTGSKFASCLCNWDCLGLISVYGTVWFFIRLWISNACCGIVESGFGASELALQQKHQSVVNRPYHRSRANHPLQTLLGRLRVFVLVFVSSFFCVPAEGPAVAPEPDDNSAAYGCFSSSTTCEWLCIHCHVDPCFFFPSAVVDFQLSFLGGLERDVRWTNRKMLGCYLRVLRRLSYRMPLT